MKRLLHPLAARTDGALGLTVGLALLMSALTTWPTPASAADTAVGNGQQTSELRTVGPFSAIALTGDIDVRLRQADAATVTVRADANAVSLVETVVDAEQTLRIGWKRGVSVRTSAPPVVEVAAPAVRAVSAKGAGHVRIDGLRVPQFALAVTGSGDAQAKGLQTDDLSLDIVGSGDVQAAGQTTRLRITISGSGDVRAAELRAAEVSVTISGSGDAQVHAERSLAVSIAGSGDVSYSGSPAVSQAVAGSGAVRKR